MTFRTTRESSQAPSSEGKHARLWGAAFALLLGVQFLYGIAMSMLFLLPKFLIETRNAPANVVGNAHGAFGLAGALAVPFVGAWLDRFGPKRIMAAGLVLGAVSFAPLGWTEGTAALLFLRAMHGVSFAAVFSAGGVLAVNLAPEPRRAEAVGYFGTASLMTNAIGPAIAEFLVASSSWRTVFVACSVFSAMSLCAAFGLPAFELPRSVPGRGRATSRFAVPLSWTLGAGYLAAAAIGVGVGASKAFVPAVLIAEGATAVAPYFVGYTAGALFQRTVLGWLPDRIGRLRASTLSLTLYGLALAGIASTPAGWALIWAPVLGMAHGAAYPASSAMAIDASRPEERGRVTTWLTGSFNLGFAVASSGFAPFEPWVGYRGLVGLGGIVLVTAGFLVRRWATPQAPIAVAEPAE